MLEDFTNAMLESGILTVYWIYVEKWHLHYEKHFTESLERGPDQVFIEKNVNESDKEAKKKVGFLKRICKEEDCNLIEAGDTSGAADKISSLIEENEIKNVLVAGGYLENCIAKFYSELGKRVGSSKIVDFIKREEGVSIYFIEELTASDTIPGNREKFYKQYKEVYDLVDKHSFSIGNPMDFYEKHFKKEKD
ncbi:MAG: hypothetical protein R6U26_02760 [Candidatus Undinarchaeales archaeon]